MSRPINDLTGLRFGMLEAVEQAGRNLTGKVMWLVRCDCGNQRVTPAHSLKTMRSCGCVRTLVPRERRKRVLDADPEAIIGVEMPKWFGLAPARLFRDYRFTQTERAFYAHVNKQEREALNTLLASISERYSK